MLGLPIALTGRIRRWRAIDAGGGSREEVGYPAALRSSWLRSASPRRGPPARPLPDGAARRACTGSTAGRSGCRRQRRSTSSASSTRASSRSCPAPRIRRSCPCSTRRLPCHGKSRTSSRCTSSSGFSQSGSCGRSQASLSERVPAWILWPFVLLVLLAPRIGDAFSIAEADLLFDYLFVLAAVLVGLWLLEQRALEARGGDGAPVGNGSHEAGRAAPRDPPRLPPRSLTTARQWRARWPALALAALVVAVVAAPWRIWYIAHDIEGEAGSQGLIQDGRPRRCLAGCAPRVRSVLGSELLERDRAALRRRAGRRRPRESRHAARVLRDAHRVRPRRGDVGDLGLLTDRNRVRARAETSSSGTWARQRCCVPRRPRCSWPPRGRASEWRR